MPRTPMSYDQDAIKRALVRAYSDLEPASRASLMFHLTDWLEDLQRLHDALAAPDELSPEALREVIDAFLVHVPNHLAAAGKLGVGLQVSDIFNVDAVDCGRGE